VLQKAVNQLQLSSQTVVLQCIVALVFKPSLPPSISARGAAGPERFDGSGTLEAAAGEHRQCVPAWSRRTHALVCCLCSAREY